jgi:hypothetical protein
MAYGDLKAVTLTQSQWAWIRGAVMDSYFDAKLGRHHYEGIAESSPELQEAAAGYLKECFELLKQQTLKGEEA